MATQTKDYYSTLGVKKTATCGRHPQGVSQTCAQIPPGRESERQEGGGEVQGDLRGERRSERRQEAQGLRPVRILFGQHRSGSGRGCGPWRLWRRIRGWWSTAPAAAGKRCHSTLGGSISPAFRAAAVSAAEPRNRRAEDSAAASATSLAGSFPVDRSHADRGREPIWSTR